MNYLRNTYSYEATFRILYITIASGLCFSICYWKSDTFLTFFIYPYLKLNSYRRLIALDIAELFSLSLYISSTVSSVLIYPFVYVQTKLLLQGAWFDTQVSDIIRFNFWLCLLFVICFVICYQIIIPSISLFFIQLDLEKYNGLLLLHLEPRVANYVNWLFFLLFITTSIIPCILLIAIYLLRKVNKRVLLINLVVKRRSIAILIFLVLVLLLPVDLDKLSLIFCCLFVVFEYTIFCCCWYN